MEHMEGNQDKEYKEKQKLTQGDSKPILPEEKKKKKSFTDIEVFSKLEG